MRYTSLLKEAILRMNDLSTQSILTTRKGGSPLILVKEKKKSLALHKDTFKGHATLRMAEFNEGEFDRYIHLFKNEIGSVDKLKDGILRFLNDLVLCSRILNDYGYAQDGFNSWKRECDDSVCMLDEIGVFLIAHVHKIHFNDEMSLRLALVEYEKHNLSIDSLSQLNPKVRDLVLMA